MNITAFGGHFKKAKEKKTMADPKLKDKSFSEIDKKFRTTVTKVSEEYENSKNEKKAAGIYGRILTAWGSIAHDIGEAANSNETIPMETMEGWKQSITELIELLKKNEKILAAEGKSATVLSSVSSCLAAMLERINEYIEEKGDVSKVENLKVAYVARQVERREKMNQARILRMKEMKKLEEEEKKEEKPETPALPKKTKETEPAPMTKEEKDAAAKEAEEKEQLHEFVNNTAMTLKAMDQALGCTNASNILKPSDEFENFRKCLKVFNLELEQSNGFVTGKNVDRLERLIIAIRYAEQQYQMHCKKVPRKSDDRKLRINLIKATMSGIDVIEAKSKFFKQAQKRILGKDGDAKARTIFKETLELAKEQKKVEYVHGAF